jgi:hypothetical protein
MNNHLKISQRFTSLARDRITDDPLTTVFRAADMKAGISASVLTALLAGPQHYFDAFLFVLASNMILSTVVWFVEKDVYRHKLGTDLVVDKTPDPLFASSSARRYKDEIRDCQSLVCGVGVVSIFAVFAANPSLLVFAAAPLTRLFTAGAQFKKLAAREYALVEADYVGEEFEKAFREVEQRALEENDLDLS